MYAPTTWLCLIMLACPRLRSVRVAGWPDDLYQMGDLCLALSEGGSEDVEDAAARAYPDGLRNIVELHVNATDHAIDMESFQSVLRLPKLEKLTIDPFFGSLSSLSEGDDSIQSNLRELNLSRIVTIGDGLDMLLARCGQL